MNPPQYSNRRSFIKRAGLIVPLVLSGPNLFLRADQPQGAPLLGVGKSPAELSADLIIIGGGLGGCAAALAAARNGLHVIMTEETDWIGGQLTQQAVPPDENPWVESFGGTRTYLELRKKIREYYFKNYPLTDKARASHAFNPGNAWVSRLCHEPRVSLAVLNDLLAPYLASDKVQILLRHKAVAADVKGDRVEAIRVQDLETGHERILRAPYFADATELGDLLPMTKTEYVTGAEAKADTGEPHAADKADPNDLQGFTMSFAMDYLAGEDHMIEKPSEYDFWRNFVANPKNHPGVRLFSFDDESSKKIGFDPEARKGFWTYRRIADRDNFTPGFYASDICIVNWAHNDYTLGNLMAPDTAAQQVARAKQQSLSLLYWLQTEAPRTDGGTGWKGLRLRPDIVGTEDGLSKYPYIRESRRIRAAFTVLEQHVETHARMVATGASKDDVTAAPFKDSVGIGCYRMDIHATSGGGPGLYASTLPYQIPLGALIPKRVENLLPACKNLGVTHLTNGCYRLHPVEWNIGESVGLLVAYCVAQKHTPREVQQHDDLVADFQKELAREGVSIAWPKTGTHPV